jgi:hypothetical protein
VTWLIIGSAAAYHWFSDWRKPKDLDLLTPTEINGNPTVDVQWYEMATEVIAASKDEVFADPDLLYTLKVSHAYWDIHWDKTLYDIWQLQKRGAVLNQELHDKLVKTWTKIHGPKKVNLNQPKELFWKDAVRRQHDHEWLHTQVAFGEYPMHLDLHTDGSAVMMDRAKFFALSLDDQRKVAMEEILTIAIERADLGVQSTRIERLSAVKRAHKILCTSAAKGWFAQFLVEQAPTLIGSRWWLPHLDLVLLTL